MMPKNTPPHDEESEQALLAALMLEPKLIKQIDASIDDFYSSRNQKIYQCICELSEEGVNADFVTVNSKMKAKNWGKEVETAYIFGLGDAVPSAVTKQYKGYLSVIKRKSAARQLISLAGEINRFAQNGLNDISGKITHTIGQLTEIREKAEGKHQSIKEKVRAWALLQSGDYFVTSCYADLGAVTIRDKGTIRQTFVRLENENVVVRCGSKSGCYRTIEKDAPIIDFINVNLSAPFPIIWPFGIHEIVDIYPGNVIVVAGAANAGKTAFMLNVVRQNMLNHRIEYFSSEMGPEEIHLRLRKFPDIDISEWRFTPRVKSSKFSDVIVPDAVNIIDYLEVTEDPWKVGGEIKGIFDRLNKGIAIIALQKKTGTDIGRGGEFTLEKPRLYLAMEKGTLKIVKGKNWSNPEINPNGWEWKFKLVQGCRFIETGGSAWNLE